MFSPSREIFRKYTNTETFEKIVEMESVSEMWARCIRDYPMQPAIVDNGASYTYEQLDQDISCFRTLLRKQDGSGGRIGIFVPNSYEFVKAFLAAVTLGSCAVILPPQLDEMSVFGCCMKYGIEMLVYAPELSEKTSLVASKRPDIVLISSSETSSENTPMIFPESKAPCVIMFTGGTTGKSKGALLSNGAVMQGVVNGCYGYEHVFLNRYLLILPLSHVFGLIRNLLTSLYTGSELFICRNTKDMFRDIATFKPTILVLVPALAEMALTLSKKFGRNMLGDDLQYIICGAAAVAPYLVEEYGKKGVKLFPGYGLTESSNLVSGNPDCAEAPDSVGYLYPNQEYKVMNGELWLKGKNMMTGYIGETENDVYEDGFFKTGDLVRFDEKGRLYITGRLKEVIVLSNGENVSPAEVEAHFNTLPFIQDSQVFEDRNESGVSILALEVVPRATELSKLGEGDVNSRILEELQKINQTLPLFQRVNKITIRDSDFARTPSMKIVRYQK